MRLKAKLLLLAAVPLLLSLALIAAAVAVQQRQLARGEHALVEGGLVTARRAELRNYVDLALSMVQPLVDSGKDDEATRQEAMRLLASLDYGSDGYFFVYDLHGKLLMHPRQPDLVGMDLSGLRDPLGGAPIQDLLARARAGGGYVDYLWRRPSTGQVARKLGYVVEIPRWGWMVGTGLYRDDIDAATSQLDAQASSNITTTLLWIGAIACCGLGLISASGIWLNLSEHRVADAKLQLLARQVVQFQEDERAHLARELHDGATQTMVSAKLQVESAIEQLEREHRAAPPALARVLSALRESLNEVRRISHRLRPAMLDELGLPAALELLGREAGDGEHGRIDVHIAGEPCELPDEIKTALFRVSQEALTNIAKHAQARHIRIELDYAAERVELRIADDGRGFDFARSQQDATRGIGLRNMRERLASIGGDFKVRTAPGAGTTLVASVARASILRLQGSAVAMTATARD
ncbi:cache domain-containing protein [Pelomonas sp. KK5]|uniref:cache domain-containing protein n=1 Tax=Pelomonas sp. KK5 TaxID=1855730 RepID=UPI00097C1DEE|nr:cache domain-containing protein [Pelomonas sp. KK5]